MTALRTLRRLSGADWMLLAEALYLFTMVRAGLCVLRFTTLRERLRRFPVSGHRPIDRLTWAVEAVSRRCPGTTCLVEALIVDTILRRHGHSPTLRIGVRHAAAVPRSSTVDGHAWVECDGRVIIGAVTDLHEYAVLS